MCIIVSSVIDKRGELEVLPCGDDLVIWENEFVRYKLMRDDTNETIFIECKDVEMSEKLMYFAYLTQSEQKIVTLLKILENEV